MVLRRSRRRRSAAQAFVSSCIDTFIKGNLPGGGWPASAGGDGAAAGLFDGIDLDWEYPTQVAGGNVDVSPADRHNATLLAAEFRKQLDAYGATTGKHYLLTAALPAATSATKYYELGAFSKYLDWDNVMAYDYNVPGGTVAAPDTLFGHDPRDPDAKRLDLEHRRHGRRTTCSTAYRRRRSWSACRSTATSTSTPARTSHGLYTSFDNTGLDPNSLTADSATAADLPRAGRRGRVRERRRQDRRERLHGLLGRRWRASRTCPARRRRTRR